MASYPPRIWESTKGYYENTEYTVEQISQMDGYPSKRRIEAVAKEKKWVKYDRTTQTTQTTQKRTLKQQAFLDKVFDKFVKEYNASPLATMAFKDLFALCDLQLKLETIINESERQSSNPNPNHDKYELAYYATERGQEFLREREAFIHALEVKNNGV